MHALSHVLNIGTLATWMSVGTFGTVGVIIPGWDDVFAPRAMAAQESVWIEPEITLGDAARTENLEASAQNATVETLDPLEPLAPPPELPEMAELPPLPEVPDLQPPPRSEEKVSNVTPRPTPPPAVRRPAAAAASDAKPAPALTAARAATGAPGNGKPGGAANGRSSGMSDSDRLAAGRMSSPSYPPYSRRNNQTGTVVVEFTVDTNGRVISAYVKKSSSWPLLDNGAVSTVRSWKFPPGGIMKLQRPIVFRLN